jgi:hypothetical protein
MNGWGREYLANEGKFRDRVPALTTSRGWPQPRAARFAAAAGRMTAQAQAYD